VRDFVIATTVEILIDEYYEAQSLDPYAYTGDMITSGRWYFKRNLHCCDLGGGEVVTDNGSARNINTFGIPQPC